MNIKYHTSFYGDKKKKKVLIKHIVMWK